MDKGGPSHTLACHHLHPEVLQEEGKCGFRLRRPGGIVAHLVTHSLIYHMTIYLAGHANIVSAALS